MGFLVVGRLIVVLVDDRPGLCMREARREDASISTHDAPGSISGLLDVWHPSIPRVTFAGAGAPLHHALCDDVA
jgi:hypothetical protein